MKNIEFEIPQNPNNKEIQKSENKSYESFNPEGELSGPSLRIFNATKKELGKLFEFGLKSIDENDDNELLSEINRHFFANRGMMENKIREWNAALSDVNRAAEKVEGEVAQNFARTIYGFITTESKIKDRFNN